MRATVGILLMALALGACDRSYGRLPQGDSFVDVDQENIVVTALKKAEDNDDMILRCYEAQRVQTRATIRLRHWDRVIHANFGPCEIKSFRIPRDGTRPVVETNLLEWTEEEADQALDQQAQHGLTTA